MKKNNQSWIYPLIVLAFASIFMPVCLAQKPSYPIDTKVSTTLERTVIPVPVPSGSPEILPCELSKYAQYGYGVWKFGPGLPCQKRLDLMPDAYTAAKVTK